MFFSGIVFSALITFLSVFVGIVLLHKRSERGERRPGHHLLPCGSADTGGCHLGPAPDQDCLPERDRSGASHSLHRLALPYSADAYHPALGAGRSPCLLVGSRFPLIPLGFGLGFSLAGPTIAVQNEAPTEMVGAAIGLTRFLSSLGGALGISLLTAFETWRFAVLSQAASDPSGQHERPRDHVQRDLPHPRRSSSSSPSDSAFSSRGGSRKIHRGRGAASGFA